MKPVSKDETFTALLKVNNQLQEEIRDKLQCQIDNQKRFENRWSKVKIGAGLFAIGTPLASLFFGIINPEQDFPILADRTMEVLKQAYLIWGRQ